MKLNMKSKLTFLVLLISTSLNLFLTGSPSTVHAATLTSQEYEQGYHYMVPSGFMNDIQTIWKGRDGYYHLYYLYNQNYKHLGDGTEWYHVRTKDFVHYENIGVSIPKFQNGWASVATGSVLYNTEKVFKDLPSSALIAYFTSYTDQGQMQYCCYSTDDGRSYKKYVENPVLKATSKDVNFRDPYVFFNQATKQLTMYLAEGDKVGVYTSSNGQDFKYVGAVVLNQYSLDGKDLGTIECPNLKKVYDSSTGTDKYVLFFYGNGYKYNQTTGSYYIIGHLNSKGVFQPEQQPERVDEGSDFYGANYYQDMSNNIITIGWLGNWGYSSNDVVDDKGDPSYHLGSMSISRKLSIEARAGNCSLKSNIISDTKLYTNSFIGTSSFKDVNKSQDNYYQLLNTNRWSHQLVKLILSNADSNKRIYGHMRINFKQKDAWIRLDYDPSNGYYMVTRRSDHVKNYINSEYGKSYVEKLFLTL